MPRSFNPIPFSLYISRTNWSIIAIFLSHYLSFSHFLIRSHNAISGGRALSFYQAQVVWWHYCRRSIDGAIDLIDIVEVARWRMIEEKNNALLVLHKQLCANCEFMQYACKGKQFVRFPKPYWGTVSQLCKDALLHEYSYFIISI